MAEIKEFQNTSNVLTNLLYKIIQFSKIMFLVEIALEKIDPLLAT